MPPVSPLVQHSISRLILIAAGTILSASLLTSSPASARRLAVPVDTVGIVYTGLTAYTAAPSSNRQSISVSYTIQTSGNSSAPSGSFIFSLNGNSPSGSFTGSCQSPVSAVAGAVDLGNGLSNSGTASCVIDGVPVNGTYNLTASPDPSSYSVLPTLVGDVTVVIQTVNSGSGSLAADGFQNGGYLAVRYAPNGKYPAAGLLAAVAGTKLEFAVGASYTQRGLRGNADVTIRSQCLTGIPGYVPNPGRDGLCAYKISSTELESLTVNDAYAELFAMASVSDVTTTPTLVASNLQLQLRASTPDSHSLDKGTLAIQVIDRTYGLWFSNNWTGVDTPISSTAPYIQAGSIRIH